jgi:hypothetical protein
MDTNVLLLGIVGLAILFRLLDPWVQKVLGNKPKR